MLSSKLAFVTGAGSGIGRASCIAFAKENARVVAVDKNLKNANHVLEIINGKEHSAFELDVSKSENVKNIFDKILEKYNEPPSIVVNCAGITMDSFLLDMNENAFKKVLEVNLLGTFYVVQNCAKLLTERKLPGSIINIASIIGKTGNIGQCNYAASKAGVELFTKTAAMELGKFNIRCNSVLPGFINTPMVQTVPDKVKEMFQKKIGLKRMGEPEEVAQVITFLASDQSSYINGASIEVTGGGL